MPATPCELFTALLPDRERVLGPDHPDTLATRHNIALLDRAEPGMPARPWGCSPQLLPDQQRVLGPDHPDTLRTRNNIAMFDRAER